MNFMIDAGWTVLPVNPVGAEQLGYTVEDLVGRSVLTVFYEPDREAVQRNVARCFEPDAPALSWELRKDGTVIWVPETARAGGARVAAGDGADAARVLRGLCCSL